MRMCSIIKVSLCLGIITWIKIDVDAQDPGQKLSEFLIDSGRDKYAELLNSDFVQKVLMSGEVNEASKAIAPRFYKSYSDIIPKRNWILGPAINTLHFDEEEKQFLKGLKIDKLDKKQPYAKWEEDMKSVFGADVTKLGGLPTKFDDTYAKQYETVKKNEMQILTSILPRLFILSDLRNYLDGKGKYKDNKVAKLFLLNDFDTDDKHYPQDRKFIDKRAKDVSDDKNTELRDVYQKFMENEVNWWLNVFSGANYS